MYYVKDEDGDITENIYDLRNNNSNECRLDVVNGDKIEISGSVTMKKLENVLSV